MNNFTKLLEQHPRLRDWAAIGPLQRAELEAFAADLLDSEASALTADGALVKPGDEVWVLSSTGKPSPTKVMVKRALTSYYLFDYIPVEHSFSSEQAAQLFIRHNK